MIKVTDEAMHECPERIWIEQDECPYFYEESELSEVGSPVTEYIRADLCHHHSTSRCIAVKQLEWVRPSGAHFWRAICAFDSVYGITEYSVDAGKGTFQLSSPFLSEMQFFRTLEAAKAAAQADFDRRVLECIDADINEVSITRSSGCVFEDLGVDVAAVRRQAFEEVEHAIGSTVLQHQASDYEGMNSLEAYEAGQINGLECAQSSLVALSADLTKEERR